MANVPVIFGDFAGTVLDKNITFSFKAGGLPDIRNGEVYVCIDTDQLEISDFNFTGTRSGLSSKIESVKSFGSGVISKVTGAEEAKTADEVKKKAIDNLASTAKDLAVKTAEKHLGLSKEDIQVWLSDEIKQKLPDLLSKNLCNTAVYSLDNLGWKGKLLSATYKGVELKDGDAYVEFTLGSLMVKALMFLFAVLITIGLIYSGVWPIFAIA